MKKLFIKIAKIFGFEIIDQNSFSSPTLDKKINEDLSILNEKSIVLFPVSPNEYRQFVPLFVVASAVALSELFEFLAIGISGFETLSVNHADYV